MSNLGAKLFGGSGRKAKIVDRTPQFREIGTFTAEVRECKLFETREDGPAWIVEFNILTSDNPDVKPGASRSWFQSMQGKSADVGYPLIYKFCFACDGVDRKGLGEEDIYAAQDAYEKQLIDLPADFMAKKQLKIVVTETKGKGKNEGKTYTNPNFYPLDLS